MMGYSGRDISSQLPQPLQRLQNLLDLLDAGFGAFAEVGGEGGGIWAGEGEEFLDSGDLGAESGGPGRQGDADRGAVNCGIGEIKGGLGRLRRGSRLGGAASPYRVLIFRP